MSSLQIIKTLIKATVDPCFFSPFYPIFFFFMLMFLWIICIQERGLEWRSVKSSSQAILYITFVGKCWHVFENGSRFNCHLRISALVRWDWHFDWTKRIKDAKRKNGYWVFLLKTDGRHHCFMEQRKHTCLFSSI